MSIGFGISASKEGVDRVDNVVDFAFLKVLMAPDVKRAPVEPFCYGIFFFDVSEEFLVHRLV
jgi:hypothetical protein